MLFNEKRRNFLMEKEDNNEISGNEFELPPFPLLQLFSYIKWGVGGGRGVVSGRVSEVNLRTNEIIPPDFGH